MPSPLSAERTACWLRGPARFSTTRWSLVLEAAGQDEARHAALEEFCRVYWYPVYAFIRRRGNDPETARDLTQGFFGKLLEKEWLAGVERRETRFSTRLCATLKNYLASEYRKASAEKRGGGQALLSLDLAQAEAWFGAEPATEETPERLFEKRWAEAVIEAALRRLQADCQEMGRGALHAALSRFLSSEPRDGDYEAAGLALGLSRAAVAQAVRRLRQQFAALVREEVAAGLDDPAMVEEEMRSLASAL